ncbi:MAG: hypothetical protein GEV08_10250 [Acidimicrobiia bacterium]|nr:hypothetical protein [Acidimicrobiia bacterium]
MPLQVRPPDELGPVGPWPPERPAGLAGYRLVLAWGPFTVEIPDGHRIGYALSEVRDEGSTYLTWHDGGRVHALADAPTWSAPASLPGWLVCPDGAGPGAYAVVRPVAEADYARLAGLPVPAVLARLRRGWAIPS